MQIYHPAQGYFTTIFAEHLVSPPFQDYLVYKIEKKETNQVVC
jgi:hypothetical protein